eukprot:TRINITY_DN11736_c0_g1_i1.p1 TRINITY_DN11736_c0_g1~~TRINITY_DN11736_c0_g1_i1.p1  ORF type:complete len:911 (+),score=225.88 TRINITY_DN11736_c0_g1_i1:86-2734(+)
MGPVAESDIEAGEQTKLIAGPPTRRDQDHRRRRRALLVAGPVCAAFLALDLGLEFRGAQPPGVRSTSASKAAAAGISPCRAELHALCGGEKPGADCLNCTAHHKSLNPKSASSLYWCEQWDIDAFCRPEGAPAAKLAPVQQEESREPASVEEFVLDSYAVCRMYGFAIGPAYIMLLRAGFTALFLAWLSILPQPLGSGEPSVPGALAVVAGVCLVARSLFASLEILFVLPVPEFADSWYQMYEIKWWVALQHPAFGQACSVLLHKFFGWISTELAWRRKAAKWDRERRADEMFKSKRDKKIKQGVISKFTTKSGQNPSSVTSDKGSKTPAGAKQATTWFGPGQRQEGGRHEEKRYSVWQKENADSRRQAEGGRPPRPPGGEAVRFLFDVAEALKPPPEAALGKWATVILRLSLVLAFVNFVIIGFPLSFTHLLPSALLALPVFFVGLPVLDWWRAMGLQLGDCILAGASIAGAGWLMAYLKQCVTECGCREGTEVEQEDWARDNSCTRRLGFTGMKPNHPAMFAARAMFVKGLSLVSALLAIICQDATSQAILFRHRDPMRFYQCTVMMGVTLGLLYTLHRMCESPAFTVFTLVLALAAGKGCSYLLGPMVHSPAEVFDARQTCAFEQCALHNFGLGIMGALEGYFELRPFVTAIMRSVSPVDCYYDVEYAALNWALVAAVFVGITVVAFLLYHLTAECRDNLREDDTEVLKSIRIAAFDPLPIRAGKANVQFVRGGVHRVTLAKGEHQTIVCKSTDIHSGAAEWQFRVAEAHGPDLSGCVEVGVVLKDQTAFGERGCMSITGKGKVKRDGGPEPKAIVRPGAVRTGDTLHFLLDMDVLTFAVSINGETVAVFEELDHANNYAPAVRINAKQGADIAVEFFK